MLDMIPEPGLARNPVWTEDSLRIACLGECMVEMAPAPEAQALFRLGAAGDSFNTAVYLARLEGGGAPRGGDMGHASGPTLKPFRSRRVLLSHGGQLGS